MLQGFLKFEASKKTKGGHAGTQSTRKYFKDYFAFVQLLFLKWVNLIISVDRPVKEGENLVRTSG